MDDKGRVAIPRIFRDILASDGVRRLWVTRSERCLDVYSPDQWKSHLDWPRYLTGNG